MDFSKDAGDAAEAATAEGLKSKINLSGIKVSFLAVLFDDGKATITGSTASSADKEKITLIAGNTAGVTNVNNRIEVTGPPEPAFTTYTVQKGDTLSKIAAATLGEARRYPEIFEANKPMLKDANHIYPGQVLRIPPKSNA